MVYFLSALPSAYLIERLGRRFLSLFQLCGCLFSLSLLTIFVSVQVRTFYLFCADDNFLAYDNKNAYGNLGCDNGGSVEFCIDRRSATLHGLLRGNSHLPL